MYLVVGLGNPGREYGDNRHNIGFLVLDQLCQRWRVPALRSKFGGQVEKVEAAGQTVVLLKPMEFMNLSGQATQRTAAFYQVEARQIVVIHDDIDLDFGRVKVKVGGGHGGHNGLRSLSEHLGPDYVRVRCGVGHPGDKSRVVGHVLGPFSKAEQKELPFFLDAAAEAVETLLRRGTTAAMNQLNSDRGSAS